MISYSHDMSLFIASVVVSFVAAFTGLALTNNISRLPDAQRKALIVMSAFILGGGIWSMHFVAMLAVKIDQPVYYDLLQTLGSALVAILVAGLALLILHFSSRTPRLLTLAGVILGLGIVAMHFIGMNGMRGVTPNVSATAVMLTIVVAIVTGVAAIRAAYGNRSRQNIIAGAAVFGSAVVAVHFTAMHGTRFVPGPPPDSQSVFIGDGTLAVTVTIAVFIICGAFLLAATTFISRPQQSAPLRTSAHTSGGTPEPATDAAATSAQITSTLNRNEVAARVIDADLETAESIVDANTSQETGSGTNSERAVPFDPSQRNVAAHGAVIDGIEHGGNDSGTTPGIIEQVGIAHSGGDHGTEEPAVPLPTQEDAIPAVADARSADAVAAGSVAAVADATTHTRIGVNDVSTKIPYERNKKILFIPGSEVGAIRADGRYTHLYTESGTLFCPWSITEAETRLSDNGFFRSHRSYLVNLAHLSGFEKNRDAGVCLFDNLQQLTTVPVSRKRVPELINVLGI